MAKERYLVLWKDDPKGIMWRVFDVLPDTNTTGPWYKYIRSMGKHPGLILMTDKDWIEQYVEQS